MRAAVDPPRPAFISITTSRRTSPWCVAESAVKDFAEGRDENPNVLVSVTCRETDTQDGVALRDCGVADRTDHEAATSQLSLSCDSTRFRSNRDPDDRAAIMGGRGRNEVSFGQEATCLGDVGLKFTDPTCVSS